MLVPLPPIGLPPVPDPTEPVKDTIQLTQKRLKAIEALLRKAGFDPGKIDGKLTSQARQALSQFQSAVGLDGSGYLDKDTVKKLSALAKRLKAKKGLLGAGQKSARIKALEQKLRRLGYKGVKADGVYDLATARAVKQFKRDDYGKQGSGLLGKKSIGRLNNDVRDLKHDPYHWRVSKGLSHHRKLDAQTADAAAKEHADGTVGVGPGATGDAVRNIQGHLHGAGYPAYHQRGTYDDRTEGMVKELQRKVGLPVTGRVDAKTWKALKDAYLYAKGKNKDFSPAQSLGERSSSVKRSQALLKKLGYKVKANGVFDKATEKASRAFERKHKGNGSDGKIDLHQYKAMQKAYKKLISGGGQIHGADMSKWQSDAEFKSVSKNLAWSATKATEGTSYTDPTFKGRWNWLHQRVGNGQGKMKLRVAYHFLTPGNGVAQAKHFLDVVGVHGKLPKGTRLALDWESSALGDPSCLHDAASYIHKVTGTWPLVYCSGSQAGRAHQIVPHAPLWVAQWGSNIPKNYPFVQYSDGPGYDHDVYNGSTASLEHFAGWR